MVDGEFANSANGRLACITRGNLKYRLKVKRRVIRVFNDFRDFELFVTTFRVDNNEISARYIALHLILEFNWNNKIRNYLYCAKKHLFLSTPFLHLYICFFFFLHDNREIFALDNKIEVIEGVLQRYREKSKSKGCLVEILEIMKIILCFINCVAGSCCCYVKYFNDTDINLGNLGNS